MDDHYAVISGSGVLPRLAAEALEARGARVQVLTFPSQKYDWLESRKTQSVDLGNFAQVLSGLFEDGFRKLLFAGAVNRPNETLVGSDAALLDFSRGDDTAVKSLVSAVENIGFEVVGVHSVLPHLLEGPGVLTRTSPKEDDVSDAARAAEVVAALGEVDVGQAAIVVDRTCVAVETVGTDAMIAFACTILRGGGVARRGVLYKSPKPNQELRVDMPVVGPDTVLNAAKAGLAGIAVKAESVLFLDRELAVRHADEHGLFIWSRREDD